MVGNPPYVFEANNRAVFQRLRQLPGWDDIHRGKSDYLYYFLWLASEQVAEGGRIAVITPAGWMNAGDAGWLRERMASQLRLDEMFLFGCDRLFAPEHERCPRPSPSAGADRRERDPDRDEGAGRRNVITSASLCSRTSARSLGR